MSIDGSWHRRVQVQILALARTLDLDVTDIDDVFCALDDMPDRLRALAKLIESERHDDVSMLYGSGYKDRSAEQRELRERAFPEPADRFL